MSAVEMIRRCGQHQKGNGPMEQTQEQLTSGAPYLPPSDQGIEGHETLPLADESIWEIG